MDTATANQNQLQNAIPTNEQGVVPQPQNQQDQQFAESLDSQSPKPFYKEWTFWVLSILIMVLIGVVSILVVPSLSQQLDAEVLADGEVARVHIKRLVTNVPGYLVVESDDNGVPGVVIVKSPYMAPDDYKDFYIPLSVDDEPQDDAKYREMAASGSFFITFYSSPSNQSFEVNENTPIAKSGTGKSLRLKFVGGKVAQ